MSIPVVYVAGPFRDSSTWRVEQNVRRAERDALRIWNLGCAAICPHTNTRFFDGEIPDDHVLPAYLEILSRCDAMLVSSLRDGSVGTMAEINHAKTLGIPVTVSIDELKMWIAAKKSGDTK